MRRVKLAHAAAPGRAGTPLAGCLPQCAVSDIVFSTKPARIPPVLPAVTSTRVRHKLLVVLCAMWLLAQGARGQNPTPSQKALAAYKRGIISSQKGDLAGARRALD